MNARPDPFWIDEPFIRQTGTGNEHYHTDALGSSLALSNSAGVAATTYTYEPFGRTTTAGSSGNSFQYTGRENDGTGLSYYRARYYQPRLQRFIGEDPIGFAGGDLNLYAYVLNNPTRFVDPLGLDWFRPPSEDYFAGRDKSLVEKGPGEIGGFIDDEVPAGHTFAIFHDAFVDMAVPVGMSWGLSYKSADYLFNIPSMPGMYIIAVEAELYNSLIKMRDKLRDKKRDRDGGLGRRK